MTNDAVKALFTDAMRQPVYFVHHVSVNTCVRIAYGFKFDFILATGTPPNTFVEYRIDGYYAEHTAASQRAADRLRKRHRTNNIQLILNTLALDGVIPFGTYVVCTHDETPPVAAYRRLMRLVMDPFLGLCRRFRGRFPKLAAAFAAIDNAVLRRPNDGSV